MELEVGYTSQHDDASEEAIRKAIANLPESGDNFVILTKADQVYIQVAGCSRNGYQLEYRDGSESEHFEAEEEITEEQVIAAFLCYFRRDDEFKKHFRWHRWSGLHSRSGCLGALVVAGLLAALISWAL